MTHTHTTHMHSINIRYTSSLQGLMYIDKINLTKIQVYVIATDTKSVVFT